MSEVRVPVRVLPSGKVYRQMFDAEVQLVNSLHAKKPEKLRLPPLQLSNEYAPIAKNKDLKSPGNILTDRQKSWMIGMPNDYATENPVKYRQLTTEATSKLHEDEPDIEIIEVRGLPNELNKSKRESNIIDKIAEKRKERHEIAVEKMHDDLCTISNRIEPRIIEIGQMLMKQFAEDDEKIKAIFKEIELDEELINFTHAMLESLWNKVEEHSPKRKAWVELADTNFCLIENERIEAISGVFRKYAAVLEKVASLMPVDVQRFIEKESMMANQSILANRRAYAKLRINLLESDIQREMVQHLTWHERVQDWKKLNAEIAVKNFIDFMNGEEISNPPEIEEINNKHLQEQKYLNEKRKEILEQLLEFKPPTSSKTSVYKWNSALSKSQENIDQLHMKWVRTLNEKYENVCQQCLAEIDKYRQNLLQSKVCSEEDVQRIVNEHMLPLVGHRQREFEKVLEQMDQTLESLAIRTEHQLKRLFKFTQGAAHLWDVHEIGLAKQERKLQNDLDESRQKHDVDNQDRESKLDVVMDRLRQESTEEALTSFLQKSLEMLEHIYNGYEEFNEEQLNIVTNYPDMVKSEIQRYDDAVCTFFNVDRNKPSPPKVSKKLGVGRLRAHASTARRLSGVRPISAEQLHMRRRSSSVNVPERKTHSAEYNKKAPSRSPSPLARPISPKPVIEEKAKILRDTLITNKGTSFYVVTVADKEDFEEEGEKEEVKEDDDAINDGRKSSALSGSAFLTEVSGESGQPEMPIYIRTVYLETSFLRDFKKNIRMQFLNHLETWSERAMVNAENSARDKHEELASELDLRKHLHEPRSKRIELDVHNVRAAELVLHKERVSRHCKGITAALLGLKQEFDEMTKDHESQASNFRTKIEGMENIFINATKSAKLVELTNSLHGNLDGYMQVIKASLRNFRQTLDNTLSRLRDSNAQCLKSFKLFSQGGNFSPDETVGLRKKLEKMSQRVDAAEGVIMQDLEGMESKRLDQATEVISKFEDRFRNHMTDLIFIEKIQRWITNSQVRIKTEVAHCNGMGASVARHVKLVKSRIDACKHPNPDKEDITPKFLCQYTNEVMSCLHTRADYLDCKIKEVEEAPQQSSTQDLTDRTPVEKPLSRGGSGMNTTPSSRQKSRQTQRRTSKGSSKPTPPGVSAPSRTDLQTGGTSRRAQHQEDSAIGMIKSILKAQKGMDPESEDLRSVMTAGTRPLPSTAASQTGTSRMQKSNFKRQGTLSSIAGSTTDSDKKRENGSRVGSGTYKRRETKFEMRHMVFGTSSNHGTHFEARIQQILYETLDGLLSTGEIYYKQKGSRAVTRPDHMQDTFDQFSDVVVAKLLNYEAQTKEYHNTSLQEFRRQLKILEEDLAEVPNLVLDEILRRSLENLRKEQQIIQAEFSTKELNWNKVKENHKVSLRPTLGHPDQEEKLQQLINKEQERQADNMNGIQEHSKELIEKAHEVTKQFLLNIGQTCASLLEQFDYSLTIDDVNSGKIEIKKEPTSILLRKQAAGIDLHDTSYRPSLPRGSNVWPGLDVSHLLSQEEVVAEVAEDINCDKTTLSHTSSVTKRDQCLASFTEAYNSVMHEIEEQAELRTLSEKRWEENWRQSVKNVQELYM